MCLSTVCVVVWFAGGVGEKKEERGRWGGGNVWPYVRSAA